ncbi:MAG: tyrosine-type recombinase/integrase, partial [Chloroflexota bacterium]
DLLVTFRRVRLAEGAQAQSVRREVSQVRSLLRECRTVSPHVSLAALFTDMSLLAQALIEPSIPVSQHTGRTRLLAAQRFIRIIGPSLGRNPVTDLAELDTRLPAQRSRGWHAHGTLVAGAPSRRRRGPTLDATDLRHIVDAAGHGAGANACRNRALVALLCFSGLRPQEVVRLRWEDVATELSSTGRYELTARVMRRGSRVTLFLPDPAAESIIDLARSASGPVEVLYGPVFYAHRAPSRPLSYRSARDVLTAACVRAGLHAVDAAALRAACAQWLRAQGLSDHVVMVVLGLARVRSIDRLLRKHVALSAQRTIHEMLDS